MSRTELRSLPAFFAALARRFGDIRTLQTAGALAFTTLLAIVPLFTVALWMFGGVPAFAELFAAFERFLAAQMLPEASLGASVTERIDEFRNNAARVGVLGLGFLLGVAVLMLLTIEETLNRVFGVTRRRALLRRLLVYAVLLALGPLLIGASLTMTSYVAGASIGLLDLGEGARTALRVLPFAFTCAALSALYFLGPNRRVAPGHALLGGLFAAALFELAKRGFALFISKFPTYTLVYGAFAALPMFLLWLYLSWLVVLVGATLTAQLTLDGGGA